MSVSKDTESISEDSEGNMNVENITEEHSVEDSESDNENVGNSGWADAMCKVLSTNVKKERNFILSKAKKNTDIKVKEKEEIELVDDGGNVIKSKKSDTVSKTKSYKEQRKEMLEKQKLKIAWESMCRVKPEVTDKDRERELLRIATRGVVHLFNTVEKHQKSKKSPKERNARKKENLGAVKGNFMDILRSHSKRDQMSEADPVMKKVKQEETWNILKDDFMMGAEMKDWDKESNSDQ